MAKQWITERNRDGDIKRSSVQRATAWEDIPASEGTGAGNGMVTKLPSFQEMDKALDRALAETRKEFGK